MAGLLGTWRGAISFIFYVLIAITVITLMNHRSFAPQAKLVRNDISSYIAKELVPDNDDRKVFNARINAIPEQYQEIGVDKPLAISAQNSSIQGEASQQGNRPVWLTWSDGALLPFSDT